MRTDESPANLLVLSLTQCANPLVDFLGSTTTDGQCRYRIEGQLGRVGLLPRVDAARFAEGPPARERSVRR